MWTTIERVLWVLAYLVAIGCWLAVEVFDWQLPPRFLAGATFIALMFAVGARSARMQLFKTPPLADERSLVRWSPTNERH